MFIRNKKHLKFVASLPCIVTMKAGESQAAHIRHGVCAMAMKPSDAYTVPLHYSEHSKQHAMPETEYWEQYGGVENARDLAFNLFLNTGEQSEAYQIIAEWREKCFLS